MIQGIYLASQSMTAMVAKQDQIANNLANANTTGFKESHLFVKAYEKSLADDQLRPNVSREVKSDEVYVNYAEGAMNKTDNPLDLSIKGPGFFSVMTPNGVGYTRNGNFSVDAEGYLVTSDGNKVLGKDSYIRLNDQEPKVTITDDGQVMQGDAVKGTLKMADFNKPYRLIRQGNSLFVPQQPDNPVLASTGHKISQGFLESSNVNLIKNMVDMITAFRSYEADQRALLAQDETLQKAITEVGKV